MAKDEYFDNYKTKQKSMKLLTSYVNSMVEPLVPVYLKKYLKDIHISWIQIKSESPIAEKLSNDARMAAPDLPDSYLESLAVKKNSEYQCENVKIFYVFPKELDLLKGFYSFVIFAVCSHDKGQLSKGYFSDLSDNYFEREDFYKLLNTNSLTAMYVNHYLASKEFPADTLFTALSAEQYEKNDSYAQISFLKKSEPCDFVYEFDKKYELSEENLRTIRKLMEITKESELALVAVKDADNIWSIVGTSKVTEAIQTIRFEGKLSWSFMENEKVIFQFYKGRYILNLGEKKKEYETQIQDVCPQYQKVVGELVKILEKQKHGTAAIISTKTSLDEEIERLCTMNKGIRIKEFDFLDSGTKEDYMNQIGMTNIDGAAFIDINGKCYAIGVIVDGETVVEGDAGRGARYNSINNYVNWLYKNKNEYFVGIIISEDGMINIVVPKSS